MVLIYKKGIWDKTENYRRILLLCTAKIYPDIIRERLERKVEKKKLLPESQRRLKNDRKAIDNIFILNHLVPREKKEKSKKVYTAFIDLKAAFDKVNGNILWKIMNDKGISKRIKRRLEEIYEETKMIRTEERLIKKFITKERMEQKCVRCFLIYTYIHI